MRSPTAGFREDLRRRNRKRLRRNEVETGGKIRQLRNEPLGVVRPTTRTSEYLSRATVKARIPRSAARLARARIRPA